MKLMKHDFKATTAISALSITSKKKMEGNVKGVGAAKEHLTQA